MRTTHIQRSALMVKVFAWFVRCLAMGEQTPRWNGRLRELINNSFCRKTRDLRRISIRFLIILRKRKSFFSVVLPNRARPASLSRLELLVTRWDYSESIVDQLSSQILLHKTSQGFCDAESIGVL